ncbi:MAG: XdhC family protein [Marinobacterium sp.]|nr:XdhC family protein [Marinobacterium sp.]
MSNHLKTLLTQWYPQRDNTDWVLGTVYKTEGPCYRKAGAMMLFSGLGQQLGMLSGGCLESDIQTHARKVMQQGQCITLCYDGSDEDDLSFQLGIGCGGTVYISLHPINRDNDYLQLHKVYQALQHRHPGQYQLNIDTTQASFTADISTAVSRLQHRARLDTDAAGQHWLTALVTPPAHLLVVGGGIDARPVVAMAHQLGWQTSLWDPRPANGRREFFMDADQLLNGPVTQLAELDIDAAILMSHNIKLDAAALASLSDKPLDYIALLGPLNRKQQVLAQSGITESQLHCPLAGPAGLSIGGELPESIALSILSECHAALYGRSGGSFSGVLLPASEPLETVRSAI